MKHKLIVTTIITLATILRFYQLGSNPPSLDWDEVSLAYNAYSIIRTGNDEYGNAFPLLSIRSFNDYKPPMYVYALIPSLLLFGKNDFAMRFPSALAGTLTVLVTYFLVKELFVSDQRLKTNSLAVLAALLLAISPWHLQFSRIAFEANLALFFFVTGIYFLIRSFRQSIFLPLSAATLGIAIFSYHSLRLIIPLLVLSILLPRLNRLKRNLKAVLTAGFISLVFLALLLRVVGQGAGQARLKTVSFFTIPNLMAKQQGIVNHRYLIYLRQFMIGYTDHFNPTFWFIDGDSNPRHHAVSFGLLYLIEAPFLIIGLIQLLRRHRPAAVILLPWFFLAPVAASITSGTPSAVRSLFFLPTFQIFTALGIIYSFKLFKVNSKLLATCYVLLAVASFASYLDLYYRHTPTETSQGWQYGYKQVVEKIMPVKDNYDKIIITTEYDQPYIYFLWYGNYDPKTWVNDGEFAKRFDNFEFRSPHWDSDKFIPNALIVGAPKEINLDQKLWSIDFLDGIPAFVAQPT